MSLLKLCQIHLLFITIHKRIDLVLLISVIYILPYCLDVYHMTTLELESADITLFCATPRWLIHEVINRTDYASHR
jgi:hypothetical protein